MATHFTTGIALRPDEVEWTVLRHTRKGTEVSGHGRLPLPSAAEANPLDTPEARAVLRQVAAQVRGEVSLAVASEKTLIRVVDLPTTDPAELKNMAELQVDKFSPFPVEHMAIAVESLSAGEKSRRVLIATLQLEIVRQLGASLQKAGLHIHRLDVEVMGWWRLLSSREQGPEKGRRAYLLLGRAGPPASDQSGGRAGASLIIAHDGIPALIRSLGTATESREAYFDELTEEVGYTLTTLEAELGVSESVPMEIWHWKEEVPEPLVGRLQQACGITSSLQVLDSLPPLSEGIARRLSEDGSLKLNLAPLEWAMAEQNRITRRHLLVATLTFLLIWLAAVAGLSVGLKLKRVRLSALDAELARLEGPAAEVRSVKERVTTFEQYLDRTYSALECLREVSSLLPQGIDLTSFSYRKGSQLSLRGESETADLIYDFIQALQQSSLFTSVKAEGVRLKAGGSRKSEFSVTALLPGAAPEASGGEEP